MVWGVNAGDRITQKPQFIANALADNSKAIAFINTVGRSRPFASADIAIASTPIGNVTWSIRHTIANTKAATQSAGRSPSPSKSRPTAALASGCVLPDWLLMKPPLKQFSAKFDCIEILHNGRRHCTSALRSISGSKLKLVKTSWNDLLPNVSVSFNWLGLLARNWFQGGALGNRPV